MATQMQRDVPKGDYVADEAKMMTVLEHLRELRNRLVISAIALVVTTMASFAVTGWFLEFLLQPARDVYPGFRLARTEMLGYVIPYFQISLTLGIIMAMPVIAYQAMMFVLPGLTPQERRWVLPVIFGITVSFLIGVAFAYYVALPPSLNFLLEFGNDTTEPVIRINSYISFVTRLVLAIGLSFELPMVIMGLARFGVVNSRKLLGWWRYAIVIAFVAAAIVTPSIDPVTQSLVAGPILVLYFLGIALARIVERPRP